MPILEVQSDGLPSIPRRRSAHFADFFIADATFFFDDFYFADAAVMAQLLLLRFADDADRI